MKNPFACLSLKARGIGTGIEVITKIKHLLANGRDHRRSGASRDFGDEYYAMNELEAAITSRTMAVLPVCWTSVPLEYGDSYGYSRPDAGYYRTTCRQFLSNEEVDYMDERMRGFYRR
jgi:hypothetical protein